MRSCEICNKAEDLRYCGGCGVASYCGHDHQREHWREHKKICRTTSKNKLNKESEAIPDTQQNGIAKANRVDTQQNGIAKANLVTQPDIAKANRVTQPEVNMDAVLKDIGDLNLRAENPAFMPQWVAQNSIALNAVDEYTEREERIVNTISSNLKQYGICVIDKFMDENSAGLCLADAVELHSQPNRFQPGQVMHQKERKRIRGDEIVWLDGTEEHTQNINYVCKKIDTIIHKCNSRIGYKISQRTKAMLACYPGKGTSYKCHIDNPSGDGRCITAIYYMNKDWDRKVMGGILRLYPKAAKTKVAEVEPKFNRLLLFYSDSRNPHEVLPAFADRYAVTIWYFDQEERAKALATWAKNLPRK